jgi:hypothetical protein
MKRKTKSMLNAYAMKKTPWLFALLLAGMTWSCNKDIELTLPVYEPKMVLEFYLEDNRALNCLLQESINFTDTTRFNLVDDALVVLSHKGIKDTLRNRFNFDLKFGKIYNYFNPKIIRLEPNVEYEVYVKDKKGREIRGKTRLNETVAIDNLVYNFDANEKATVGMIFNDQGSSKNFYRIIAFKDSVLIRENAIWDITFNDNLFNGKQFSFYTGYAFQKGDSVTGRLYHLTQEHYKFTQSANNAQSSNGNPFGQPANIISNVEGGLGIFTTLRYTEKKVAIR